MAKERKERMARKGTLKEERRKEKRKENFRARAQERDSKSLNLVGQS